MSIPNSWVDLKEDADYILNYFVEDTKITVEGMYQPLRERIVFKNINFKNHSLSFSVRRYVDIVTIVFQVIERHKL